MDNDVDILTRQRATRANRRQAGEFVRRRVPLESLGDCPTPGERRDSMAIIEAQNGTRDLDLIPLRYERMGVDPFAFLRGSAAVMASDLSLRPSTGIAVQLCGDAHLDNFGMFASAERSLTFDLTDFDETLPGPFEWDVKRLAASFAIAARVRGMTRKEVSHVVRAVGSSYRRWITGLNERPTLEVWYARADVDWMVEQVQESDLRKAFIKAGTKARAKDASAATMKLTELHDGKRRFRSDPPVVTPVDGEQYIETIAHVFRDYRATLSPDRLALLDRFTFVEAAFKVVGVGSVGTRAYALLFESGDGEPLILQAKQADASVLEAYLDPSEYANHGKRVVIGQRLIQSASDPFLGWTSGDDNIPFDFYFRQLWDMKGRIDSTRLDVKALRRYAQICAAVLARSHARAGDASMITGYLGGDHTFDHAIADYATSYAELMISDHAAFVAATSSPDASGGTSS